MLIKLFLPLVFVAALIGFTVGYLAAENHCRKECPVCTAIAPKY